ncbi:hypothetical protein NW762_006109 [Fusarium torreyae]|uniref:Xylanolytic transcriptional activator regulatory domain-containing protein n=1 Tax=Fusarium torreyae TaxID=1237075 RepID=A0A9W8S1E0_9HYPO|nr:hypothetical protein NW762_006109 [Fusarium torreyae]
MTLWYDSPEEHRNTWHWVDVAVSQAFATGLHLDLHDPLLSVRQCTLRRKIWWSCYVTDRLVSLYMKRPPRIRDDDFHVLILEDSDFETTLPPQGYHNPLQAMCRYVLDRKIRITLGKLFIEYVGLCQIMDSFLQSYRCKGLGIENQWLSNSYMHGFSNDQLGSGQLHLLLQQKMTNWRESLPNCCRYKAPSSIESISAIAVHHTVLHMLFQALMLLTHRSTLSVSQHGPNCTADEEEANVGILDAAIRISHMAGEVHETGLDSFLPASSLSAVLPAIAVLLQKVGDGEQRQISICKEGFIRCLEVITVMENIYEPARLARDAITWAIPESYHDDYPFDMEEASPMDLFTPYGETEISIENVAEISSEYNYSGSTDYTSPTTSQRSADMEPVEELCTGWIDSEFSMQLEPLATSKGLSSCKENMYSMEGLGVLNDLSLPLEWEGVYSSF